MTFGWWFFFAVLVAHLVSNVGLMVHMVQQFGSCISHGSSVWFSWFTWLFSVVLVGCIFFSVVLVVDLVYYWWILWFTLFFSLAFVVEVLLQCVCCGSRNCLVWSSCFPCWSLACFWWFLCSQCLTRGYSILFSCYVLFGSLVWFLWLLVSVVV